MKTFRTEKTSKGHIHSINTETGTVFRLMNPAEKAKRAAVELKQDRVIHPVTGRTIQQGLTPVQKAKRSGYLDAQTDNARAFNANKGKPGKGRSAIKKNGGTPTKRRWGKSRGGSSGKSSIGSPNYWD
jgi:hypothetical protein